MNETPEVLTPEMLAEAENGIRAAARYEEAFATKRDNAEIQRLFYAEEARDLQTVRDWIGPRIGRPFAEVLEEATAALAAAEASHAEKRATADAARERLRDLQGYKRIMEERVAELQEQEEQS
jgi:hypothetical protein